MADKTLDCKGLVCPMPIVKISKAVKEMVSGQSLEVLADDKAFEPDINAWCSRTGNSLASLSEADGVLTAVIRTK